MEAFPLRATAHTAVSWPRTDCPALPMLTLYNRWPFESSLYPLDQDSGIETGSFEYNGQLCLPVSLISTLSVCESALTWVIPVVFSHHE